MIKNTLHFSLVTLICTLIATTFSMCSTSVPQTAVNLDSKPAIKPDYADVTIPRNIAPLNFVIDDEADDYVTHIHTPGNDGIVISGKVVEIDPDAWRAMLDSADELSIDVYLKRQGKWLKCEPFGMKVAEEIDPYISYRLIEPSFVNYEVMSINQRCLEDFTTKEIYNNCSVTDEERGQCANCHNYQNYNADGNMQMHLRGYLGGTLIAYGGELKEVPMKNEFTLSAGVYPTWHPALPLIAYSNNITRQNFHNADPNKIEVYDTNSSLVLYDVASGEITEISNDSTLMETFPNWSPDGRTLYFVAAKVPPMADEERSKYAVDNYKQIKYDIYRKSFDPDTRKFGATDTVYMASEQGKSATLPRVSPDGKYLLFTMAEYGTFHIWHHDADLYIMDLTTGDVRPLTEANSLDTESYHSWSSNGHWIMMSSRRDDGSFTRLYFSHIGPDGKASKPFMLPQKDPRSNLSLYKSYNVPEFMVKPVCISRADILEAIKE